MVDYIVRHQVSAGHDLDGTAPQGDPTIINTRTIYPVEAAGGEFEPGAGTLKTISLHAGGQSSAEGKIVYGAGGEKQIFVCLEPRHQFLWKGQEALSAGDKVVVVTRNAAHAITCDLCYEG